MVKSNPCKLCSSTYHTRAFCHLKPRKPIARTTKKKLQVVQKSKPKKLSRKQLVKKLDQKRLAVCYDCNMIVKKCMKCKKEYKVRKDRAILSKFCSMGCLNAHRAENNKNTYSIPRICVHCNKEYLPTNWSQKFCSRSCFFESEKKTKLTLCTTCGTEFMQARKAQKFCSRKCSSPYRDNELKKPKRVTLDNVWSKAVKSRAGNKCEYCGKTSGLNSHHIFSRSNKRVRWDIDNGICVCVLHHVFGLFSAHKSPIEFVEWLKEYRGADWYDNLRERAKVNGKYIKLTKEQEKALLESLKSV